MWTPETANGILALDEHNELWDDGVLRRLYEVMRYWDDIDPASPAVELDFARASTATPPPLERPQRARSDTFNARPSRTCD